MIHTIFSVFLLLFLLLYVHICTYEASGIFKLYFRMVLTVSAVYLFRPFTQKFNLVTKRYTFAGKIFHHSVFSLCVLSLIERVPDQTWSSSASNMHPLTNLH
jgi:hypothetical protein